MGASVRRRPDIITSRLRHVKDYLAAEAARRAKHPRFEEIGGVSVPIFWPSAVSCTRQLCYQLLKPDKALPEDPESAMRLWDGQYHEATVLHWLKIMKYAVGEEQGRVRRIFSSKGKPLFIIQGKLDGVIWMNHEDEPQSYGECVCEVKGLSFFTAKMKNADDIVNRGYRDQAQLYMHLRGLPRTIFFVKNKNNSVLDPYELEYSERSVKRILKRMKRVALAVQKEKLLPREISDPKDRRCQWCRWNHLCWKKRRKT